jgi:hypothetical protein
MRASWFFGCCLPITPLLTTVSMGDSISAEWDSRRDVVNPLGASHVDQLRGDRWQQSVLGISVQMDRTTTFSLKM